MSKLVPGHRVCKRKKKIDLDFIKNFKKERSKEISVSVTTTMVESSNTEGKGE